MKQICEKINNRTDEVTVPKFSRNDFDDISNDEAIAIDQLQVITAFANSYSQLLDKYIARNAELAAKRKEEMKKQAEKLKSEKKD